MAFSSSYTSTPHVYQPNQCDKIGCLTLRCRHPPTTTVIKITQIIIKIIKSLSRFHYLSVFYVALSLIYFGKTGFTLKKLLTL